LPPEVGPGFAYGSGSPDLPSETGPGFTSRSGSPDLPPEVVPPDLPPEVSPLNLPPEVGPRICLHNWVPGFTSRRFPSWWICKVVLHKVTAQTHTHTQCDVSVRGLFTSGLSDLPQRVALWTRHQCFGRAQCLHLQGRGSTLICHSLRAWVNTDYRELQRGTFSHNPATADFDKMQGVISQSFRGVAHKIYRRPTNKSIFNILDLLQECPAITNTDFWLS